MNTNITPHHIFQIITNIFERYLIVFVIYHQVCFEKRLVVAHDLCQPIGAKGSAYGELGEIHALLGNYEQAASCLEHQVQSAR